MHARVAWFVGSIVATLVGCARSTADSVQAETVSDPDAQAGGGDASSSEPFNTCIDTRLRIPIGTTCYFELPEAPSGQQLDIDSLSLRLAGYNGDSPLDYHIERVTDAKACNRSEHQWYYYYNEAGIPLMVLCPTTCSVGEQGGQALLWVRASCL